MSEKQYYEMIHWPKSQEYFQQDGTIIISEMRCIIPTDINKEIHGIFNNWIESQKYLYNKYEKAKDTIGILDRLIKYPDTDDNDYIVNEIKEILKEYKQ